MRISDWSSDVCSSDLLRSSGESFRHHCAARPSCSALLRGNAMIVHLPHLTDLLLLRTLRLSDVEAFHVYRTRAAVARLLVWSPISMVKPLDRTSFVLGLRGSVRVYLGRFRTFHPHN